LSTSENEQRNEAIITLKHYPQSVVLESSVKPSLGLPRLSLTEASRTTDFLTRVVGTHFHQNDELNSLNPEYIEGNAPPTLNLQQTMTHAGPFCGF